MSIRAAVNQYLASRPAITALVGARIYPCKRPQGTALPALTHRRLSGGHEHNLSEASSQAMPTFLVQVWASDYKTADAIAEAVRSEMQGLEGTWGTGIRQVLVTSVILSDESDDYEESDNADENGVFRIDQQYRIQHREIVPEQH